MSGELCICATPIGHLDDITVRALRFLAEADLVLAEDTRRTGLLLKHHGLSCRLRAFHAHTPDEAIGGYIEQLEQGARIVLVSDAGTPVVSDPGARLTAAARDAGIRVTAAPGPSAVLAAIAVCGLRADHFRFLGFLPRNGAKRGRALEAIASAEEATVFFESPRRLATTLDDLGPILRERRLAVCRELTKTHEEVVRGTVNALRSHFGEDARGEITVVVEAQAQAAPELSDADLDGRIAAGLAKGLHPRELAKDLAKSTSISRREAYDRIVAIKAGE
ncbi:MAG: 16S rRNA (cytidine(1402)-2'-O)-methyltransferase [Myxococcota bacterium]